MAAINPTSDIIETSPPSQEFSFEINSAVKLGIEVRVGGGI
jgi:hypothetical protein